MIKFIHTADWHIRDSQYGKKFRGQDSVDAVMQVVHYAIEQKVDFILNSGDALDKNRPSEKMLAVMFRIHQLLIDAGIPMYIITGNHDASDPSFLSLPQFGRKSLNAGVICIDHKTVLHKGLTIAGYPAIPWENVHTSVTSSVEEAEKAGEDGRPDIILWHGAIKEWQPFGVDLEMATIWETPFRLAALLGDLHIHELERFDDGRILTYPGSTEMTKNDHRRDKYFDLYEIEDAKVERLPDPLPVPIDTRPVLFLRCSSEEEIADCVNKTRMALKEHPDKPPMIFMTYNWKFREVVPRLMAVIDTTKTILRYRCLSSTFGGVTYEKGEGQEFDLSEVQKPNLADVVDKTIHPTDPLNGIARRLAQADNDTRGTLVDFIDTRLEGSGVSRPELEKTTP